MPAAFCFAIGIVQVLPVALALAAAALATQMGCLAEGRKQHIPNSSKHVSRDQYGDSAKVSLFSILQSSSRSSTCTTAVSKHAPRTWRSCGRSMLILHIKTSRGTHAAIEDEGSVTAVSDTSSKYPLARKSRPSKPSKVTHSHCIQAAQVCAATAFASCFTHTISWKPGVTKILKGSRAPSFAEAIVLRFLSGPVGDIVKVEAGRRTHALCWAQQT